MTAQVLFFQCFFEKDPHLNAFEPFFFLSSLMSPLKLSIKNFPFEKVLSSKAITISAFPLILSTRKSNLFLINFIYKCAIVKLFQLSLQINFRLIA